mgnify:CR=1 FL=1
MRDTPSPQNRPLQGRQGAPPITLYSARPQCRASFLEVGMTDWYKSCSYDAAQKSSFHAAAISRLRALAAELRWPSGSFDIRSNRGGIAVSGEITLHHEAFYLQVAQSMIAGDRGILFRSCEASGFYRRAEPVRAAVPARRHSCAGQSRSARARAWPGRGDPAGLRESVRWIVPMPALPGQLP